MNHSTEHAQQSPLRVVTHSVIAGSDAGALLWSLDEAARQLGNVSVRTVRRLIEGGKLPVDAVEKPISADFPAKFFPPETPPFQLQIPAVIFTATSVSNLL